MKFPKIIEFKNNCNITLCKTLLSVAPEEGCALLLGKEKQGRLYKSQGIWEINLIWPCRNIWEPGIFNLHEPRTNNKKLSKSTSSPSKANRFCIDPLEQITAQRWARKNQFKVLGNAHSHISSNDKTPSSIDLIWATAACLMIIIDKNELMQAWWINNEKQFHELEIIS